MLLREKRKWVAREDFALLNKTIYRNLTRTSQAGEVPLARMIGRCKPLRVCEDHFVFSGVAIATKS